MDDTRALAAMLDGVMPDPRPLCEPLPQGAEWFEEGLKPKQQELIYESGAGADEGVLHGVMCRECGGPVVGKLQYAHIRAGARKCKSCLQHAKNRRRQKRYANDPAYREKKRREARERNREIARKKGEQG